MTIPNQAQDLALNVMMSQQAKENRSTETLVPRLTVVRTKKESPSSNGGTGSTSGKNLVSAPGVSFDNTVGEYDATEFMTRYRRARDRNEMMVAINGFIGYNNQVAFSVNEYNAKTAAQKALKPSHQETVVIKSEGKGYVAGMPDNTFKKISDLLGREKMAAEALANYELQVANLAEGSTEQLTAVGMAEIERERLIAIRADLSLLVK